VLIVVHFVATGAPVYRSQLESSSKYGFSNISRFCVSGKRYHFFTAVLLVLASIWRAIWNAQNVSFELGSLDVAVGASHAWTPC